MAVTDIQSEAIVAGGMAVSLGGLFSVTGSSNPAFLVVSALDRDEYTVAATHGTGTFFGNGQGLALSYAGGDARAAGIVFTWQASTGQYVNARFGTLSQLSYTSSSSADDVTNISLYGATSLAQAQSLATSPYALIENDAGGYLGSSTIFTAPSNAPAVPAQATPSGIAAAALSFVGDAWNMDGCWVLASAIAAEAGAGLPVQSTEVAVPGKPNGEWVVLYNGPAGGSGTWQNLVGIGDVVCFTPAGGGGHITTCVSGQGATAQLVDNIAYVSGSGIANSAHDGSANDVIVAAPHLATQEWAGVSASSVVIYALDTPAVTAAANVATTAGVTLALSGALRASDPAHRAISQYQLYDSLSGARFVIGTTDTVARSAANALSASSLSGIGLLATGPGTDTLEVRAYNGAYWGDWTSVAIAVNPPMAPHLATQTPAQIWQQGSLVGLALPAGLFTDPQHQTLTYAASGANGAALPSWLSFDAATRRFSGTVPRGAVLAFPIIVTATDTAGLSSTETFAVSVPAAPPTVAVHVAPQVWTEGSAVHFALPQGNFTDPQGQALTLRASLANSAALPSWLSFDAGAGVFSGTAPLAAQSLSLKVTATDTSGLSVYETVTASLVHATGQLIQSADWLPPALSGPQGAPAPAGSLGAWLDDHAPIGLSDLHPAHSLGSARPLG